MALDVTVLRVFTDADGTFGNALGIVDADAAPADRRQQIARELGYSETIFIHLPDRRSSTAKAHIFTPTVEIPFAGHPTVGAAWWLHSAGFSIRTLQVPAGIVQVAQAGELTEVSARSEWGPEFVIHDMSTAADVEAADPEDYADDAEHYLWSWIDEKAGQLRSRMFAANLGVPEDEATGSAAIRITDYLSRDLIINQGRGSKIYTTWSADGWVRLAGRVVSDGTRQLG